MPLAKVVHITSEELGLYSTPAGMSGNSSARLLMACGKKKQPTTRFEREVPGRAKQPTRTRTENIHNVLAKIKNYLLTFLGTKRARPTARERCWSDMFLVCLCAWWTPPKGDPGSWTESR